MPGGWFEDAWNGVAGELQKAGAQAGKTVCTWMPQQTRLQFVKFVNDNAALFRNPWFAQTLGVFPLVFADFAQSCDFSYAAREYACRIKMNCEIVLMLTPALAAGTAAAAGIMAATGVGIVGSAAAIEAMGIIAGVAAVGLPLMRAICANRPPNFSDLVALVDALLGALQAFGIKGIPTTAAADLNKLFAGVQSIPAGDAASKVRQIVAAGQAAFASGKVPTTTTTRAAPVKAPAKTQIGSAITARAQPQTFVNGTKPPAPRPSSSGGGGLALAAAAAAAFFLAR